MAKPSKPDRHEPTDTDREFASSVLDRANPLDIHYVLGTIEGCLNPGELLGEPRTPDDREVRRARALLAEWRKRQAAGRAVES
jgi:hypothetical protein